jgi:N-formylglutamate amidohydrolase
MDRHADRLFRLPAGEARPVRFPISRLVVDPERFPDDAQKPKAAAGMGAVYTRTPDGRPLQARLDKEERDRLLDRFYRPHHRAPTEAVDAALAAHGACLIIDGHSFSSRPLPHEPDQETPRPEICIGTDPFHTPAPLAAAAIELLRGAGFSVRRDRPFSGSLVSGSHYRLEPAVMSIMVEVNRAAYVDEASGEPLPGFERASETLDALLKGCWRWRGHRHLLPVVKDSRRAPSGG